MADTLKVTGLITGLKFRHRDPTIAIDWFDQDLSLYNSLLINENKITQNKFSYDLSSNYIEYKIWPKWFNDTKPSSIELIKDTSIIEFPAPGSYLNLSLSGSSTNTGGLWGYGNTTNTTKIYVRDLYNCTESNPYLLYYRYSSDEYSYEDYVVCNGASGSISSECSSGVIKGYYTNDLGIKVNYTDVNTSSAGGVYKALDDLKRTLTYKNSNSSWKASLPSTVNTYKGNTITLASTLYSTNSNSYNKTHSGTNDFGTLYFKVNNSLSETKTPKLENGSYNDYAPNWRIWTAHDSEDKSAGSSYILNFNATADALWNGWYQWTYYPNTKSITLPDITESGYTCSAWTDSQVSGKTYAQGLTNFKYGGGTTSSAPNYGASDYWKNYDSATFTATKSANTYTVKFNANYTGSTQTMSDQSRTFNDGIALTTNTFTRTGYKFLGWSDSSSGTKKFNDKTTENIGTPSTATGTVYNLYAVWESNTYTITFNKQLGTGGTDTVTCAYDSKVSGNYITAPTREGYSFIGYYTGTNGTGTRYFNTNGLQVEDWAETSDTTLYAYWVGKEWTITFNPNGGNTPSIETKTVRYNSQYGELATCSRSRYDFLGWFTESVGGTQITSTTLVSINNNHTLYAHWDLKPDSYIKMDETHWKKVLNKYVKTSDGWKEVTNAYVKTSEGWKEIINN